MVKTAALLILKNLPKIVAYVQEDLSKRFSLLEDWEITLKDPLPGTFECPEIKASGRSLVILKYTSTPDNVVCDGNTLVPEEILGIPTVVGSLAHDPMYKRLREFALAMGWTIAQARRFADQVYANILLALARAEPSWHVRNVGVVWAHISYVGVRLFGGFAYRRYRATERIVLFALAVSSILVCAGGCIPEVVEDFPMPVYTEEKGEAE